MNKTVILALCCTLLTGDLFCAQAETTRRAAATALCAAAAHSERFSYEVKPSNQVTEEEALQHATLIDSAFHLSDPRNDYKTRCSRRLAVPSTFVYELNKKRDVIVSAYNTQEGAQERVLVGGLFGTKHRNPEDDSFFGFVDILIQLNAIYVADNVQRQGIGTRMVKLFQEYTRNLPLAFYVRATNTAGERFWHNQVAFEKATGENTQIGWDLLTTEYPRTAIRQDEIVTYYSENGSLEFLDNGESIGGAGIFSDADHDETIHKD